MLMADESIVFQVISYNRWLEKYLPSGGLFCNECKILKLVLDFRCIVTLVVVYTHGVTHSTFSS